LVFAGGFVVQPQRWISLIALIAAFGCTGEKEEAEEPASYAAVGELLAPADSFPLVRYFDGDLVSLNDRCAVRKIKLNPKMPPVYVNGRPIGFC
jgi:hypothetical protein